VKPLQQWKLSAIQEKLDRLLDAHLDGVITREEYVGRKEQSLNEKAVLTEQMAEVERNGNHWLEPLEGFVKAAHQARSVACGQNCVLHHSFQKPPRIPHFSPVTQFSGSSRIKNTVFGD